MASKPMTETWQWKVFAEPIIGLTLAAVIIAAWAVV